MRDLARIYGFSTLSRVLVLCNYPARRIWPGYPMQFQYPQSGISPLQLSRAL